MNLISVASVPDVASPAVGIVINVECVGRVAPDQCNLIVAGKFRSESRPLIRRPVFGRVDDLALALPPVAVPLS